MIFSAINPTSVNVYQYISVSFSFPCLPIFILKPNVTWKVTDIWIQKGYVFLVYRMYPINYLWILRFSLMMPYLNNFVGCPLNVKFSWLFGDIGVSIQHPSSQHNTIGLGAASTNYTVLRLLFKMQILQINNYNSIYIHLYV